MIDVSQWRKNIGLWNYCFNRSVNGSCSHSFKKAAVDSKSGSRSSTLKENISQLPETQSFFAFLLLFFLILSLSICMLMIPSTSKQLHVYICYHVQSTGSTCVAVTHMNYLQSIVLPGGSSSNLICNDLYWINCLRMLLLLSGDVECNPGPLKGMHNNIVIKLFLKSIIGKILRMWNWACIRMIKFLQSFCIQIKNIFCHKQHNNVPLQTLSQKNTPLPEDITINIDTPVPLSSYSGIIIIILIILNTIRSHYCN